MVFVYGECQDAHQFALQLLFSMAGTISEKVGILLFTRDVWQICEERAAAFSIRPVLAGSACAFCFALYVCAWLSSTAQMGSLTLVAYVHEVYCK